MSQDEVLRQVPIPTVYANRVTLMTSLYDFTMDFGMMVDVDEDGITVQPLLRLILAPAMAKDIAETLSEHVKKYEADFGPLPKP